MYKPFFREEDQFWDCAWVDDITERIRRCEDTIFYETGKQMKVMWVQEMDEQCSIRPYT